MKRILSLILATAIILSCFATSIIFNVGAATGVGDYVDVLAMGGYDYAIDKSGNYRVVKVTDAAPNGNTSGKTTSFAINTDRKEIGQDYAALYNLADGSADPNNSDIDVKCYGVYEVKSNSGTYISDLASPEIFTYQTKLRATTDNAVIVYIELPDYKANGVDWGFGIAKRGNGSAYEFDIGQSTWGAFLNRKADNTTGFSYLPAGEAEWVNGTVYAEETGTRVMKTDLPSGFKGYVRFDLSKFDYMAFNEKNANSYMPGMTKLAELNFAYNGVTETDILTVGGLMYVTTANAGRILKFKDGSTAPLTEAISDQIHVLAMGGYDWGIDSNGKYRVVKVTDAAPNGNTSGMTTSFAMNTNRKEAGQPYTALYNLADGTADPENSTTEAKCYGVYEVKSNSGTYISDLASPEIFTYQTKLRATTDNAVIVYIELPDYKANGVDWGFGIAKRGNGSAYEFDIGQSTWGAFLNRKADNTTGFSYLPAGEAEWVNGTVYAEETGTRVMKTDLPSGFKGYVRFDLSKFDYMAFNEKNANSYMSGMTKLAELNFAYNGVTETDILTVGGLMYITTTSGGKVLNFKNAGYAPVVSNTLSVRAQNLITDTANETNVTGTNIKVGKINSDGSIMETDDVDNKNFVAEMSLTKSGGLFLDDGYAGAFRPSSNQGSNILLAGNTNWLNYVTDEDLGLQLKAGVNKFMFYVELPDVRHVNNVTDDSMALALRPIIIDNQYTMKPYGLTYQFMDIREGVWHDGTISDGSEDWQKYGTLLGLPTDGFKGYIKIDLDPIINNKTTDFVITKIQIGVNRAAWGAPLVIGGFYAVDVDNTDSTAYFMDSKTGEILTTKVLAGDFSGDEKYDATDLALAIKYLIKHPDVTGAQTARASAFNNPKADFNTVSLVQLKKILAGTFTPATLQ